MDGEPMNTRPMPHLGNADLLAQAQRAQQIARLQEWIALTDARVANQQRFVERVWQAFEVAKSMQPLCANFHLDYQRAADAFAHNRDQAAKLLQTQRAELARLQGGGAPGEIGAFDPARIGVGGFGGVIEGLTLSAFGPATRIADRVYFEAFIGRQQAPVHTCQPPAGSAAVAPPPAVALPGTTPPPALAPPAAAAPPPASATVKALTLAGLPPWAPYAAGGVLLLLILTGGKKR
jgi:hypothetical protein